MIEIKNENIIFVDVDGTLISKSPNGHDPVSFLNYGIEEIHFPIQEHIDLIMKNKNRGQAVVVWSQNGVSWCREVIKKLNLESYVDLIMTKPSIYVDDLPMNEWSSRIFLINQ